MKEVFIHKYSRLYYSECVQPFIYTADALELVLFCCEGVNIDQMQTPCKHHDLLLLKPFQIYSFSVPEHAYMLMTKLPCEEKETVSQYGQALFQHEEMKTLCLNIARQSDQKTKDVYLLQSYLYKLGYLMLQHYSHDVELEQTFPSIEEDRRKQIHDIIYMQSSEEISLTGLANQLHLTPQYVSQFFKAYFGCTFLHYLAQVRLNKAMTDIQYTSKSVLSIAMEYGFANIRSFQTTFAQVLHCTPKQYRKKLQNRSICELLTNEDPVYVSFMKQQIAQLPVSEIKDKEESYPLTLLANGKERNLVHTWRNLVTVGRARLLLIDDIRKQLSEIQKEIGFQMIRFHGILNDDMHVYDEDREGNPIYNFHQINDILDFLLHIGLKPFVELGFMPKKLALDPDMAIIEQLFIVSPPKDITKWQALVQALIRNCINRYGEEEVHSWHFEFWNNSGLDYDEQKPDRKRKFWQGTMKEYLEFYEATFQAVKGIHPNLRIGGPSCSIKLLEEYPENMAKYLQFMKKHNCMVDFFTFHIYPNFKGDVYGEHSTSLPRFTERLKYVMNWMKKYHLQQPFHITEWSTWGYLEQPHFNDECGKAVYLLQSMVDTLDQADSMGHWTFSDYTETMKTKENHIFRDEAGLITSNGIKKVSYHAYTLMRKLGDVQLAKGEQYIFTRKHKNYQLLLFHPQSEGEDKTTLFHIKVKQLPNGTYEKKVTFLNKDSGSAYDVWKKTGARLEIMEEDVQYLKASSLMSYVRETVEIKQHEDYESRSMKPGEALLIEWIYKY